MYTLVQVTFQFNKKTMMIDHWNRLFGVAWVLQAFEILDPEDVVCYTWQKTSFLLLATTHFVADGFGVNAARLAAFCCVEALNMFEASWTKVRFEVLRCSQQIWYSI